MSHRALNPEQFMVDAYHGTTEERAASIREEGLRRPAGVGPGWLMLTSSREDAERYAGGYEGTPTVLSVRVPRNLLTKSRPHLNGEAWGILHDHIPPRYITG